MCSQLFDTPKGVFYVGQCGVFGVCAPFLPCFAGRGFRKRFDPKFRKRFDPNSADFAGGKNRRSGDCCGRFLSFRIHGGLSRARLILPAGEMAKMSYYKKKSAAALSRGDCRINQQHKKSVAAPGEREAVDVGLPLSFRRHGHAAAVSSREGRRQG